MRVQLVTRVIITPALIPYSEMPTFLLLVLLLAGDTLLLANGYIAPQKIQIMSRVTPKGAPSLKRRALPPISIPLGDFFQGTDLQ